MFRKEKISAVRIGLQFTETLCLFLMADLVEGRVRNNTHSVGDRVAHLSSDIISNIVSRLPMKSILICKSVCKTWYSLIQDPHFVDLQLSRTTHRPSQLILFNTSMDQLLLVDSVGCVVGEIPFNVVEGWAPDIMGSCNGMLCVASVNELDPVLVWNPITRDYIILPESESKLPVLHHHLGMGFDPFTKKYKVVRVYYEYFHSSAFTFEIITIGENSWKQLDTPFGALEIGKGASVFLDGYFYWIVIYEDNIHILSLDMVEEKFQKLSLLPIVKFPLCEPHWIEWSLLSSGGILSLMAIDQRGREKKRKRCIYQLMHVWQVKINKVEGLHMRYKHTCNLYSPLCLSYNAVISKGNDGNYLLKASCGYNGIPKLVLYMSNRENHFDLSLPTTITLDTSTSFEPSLISPRGPLLGLL